MSIPLAIVVNLLQTSCATRCTVYYKSIQRSLGILAGCCRVPSQISCRILSAFSFNLSIVIHRSRCAIHIRPAEVTKPAPYSLRFSHTVIIGVRMTAIVGFLLFFHCPFISVHWVYTKLASCQFLIALLLFHIS